MKMRRIQKQADQFPVYNPDVTIMYIPEEEGPGYRAIVRRNPKGNGWDVVKRLSTKIKEDSQ